MNWELYEVWAVDKSGHEELIDTTKSRKEAYSLAEKTLTEEDYVETIVYLENEEGDLEEVKRFK